MTQKEDNTICLGCVVAIAVLAGLSIYGCAMWVFTFWNMGRPWPGGFFL